MERCVIGVRIRRGESIASPLVAKETERAARQQAQATVEAERTEKAAALAHIQALGAQLARKA